MISVPERVLVCQNPQNLCTVDCPYRSTCQINRVPMLIHTVVIHYKKGRIYGDDYINELVKIRCNSLDNVCHDRGIDLKDKLHQKIRTEAF